MKIGNPIIVRATIAVEYDAKGKRDIVRNKCEPFKAMIIGHRTKMLGQVRKPSSNIWSEDYEPAYLQVNGSIGLWEIRHGLTNIPILVAEEDFDLIEPFNLPHQARLPRYK